MATNYEFYKDEIIKEILNCGDTCDFKRKYILKSNFCYGGDDCDTCHSKTKEWLNSEYEEPYSIEELLKCEVSEG